MKKEDFYTGEPLSSGSPPFISEAEAIENASFGKYDYDPSTRISMQQQAYQQPMMYNPYFGYNPQPYPMYGLGSVSPYYQQPNPYFQFQPQYYCPPDQEVQYFVKPIDFGSEYLPPIGYEEEIERLKLEYWAKEQEASAQSSIDNRAMNPYYSGSNYYGVPYFNPFQYNNINSEISSKIASIESEAKTNRYNFNFNLSKLAHNISGDGVTDSDIEEMYHGKVVNTGVTITYADLYNQAKLQSLVPFDNSQMYRDHSAAVSAEHNKIISPDSDMENAFLNFGNLKAHYMMEEEKHRRRDGGALYNSENNSYKYFVRAKAAERHAAQKGISLGQGQPQLCPPAINAFPTLSQSAKLADDGTLSITCNFGSKAGQVYSVHNNNEAEYEQDRERFNQFLNAIPRSIYNDGPTGNDEGILT